MFWVTNFAISIAGLGDTSAYGNKNTFHEPRTISSNGAGKRNKNLGLLFDTFVPMSSILTIFIMIAFILPQNESFGLFCLLWWVLAAYVSLISANDDDDNTYLGDNGDTGLFPSSSIYDRISGVGIIVGIPFLMLLILWKWWKMEGSWPKHKGRYLRSTRGIRLPTVDPIQGFVFKHIPLWSMVAIHIYRLDGLSILIPFWNGEVPNFVGYQTILLDVIMGITAIPLTYLLYVPRKPKAKGRGSCTKQKAPPSFLRDVLWFWNSLGLYDLCSAYLVLILNVFGLGGSHIAQPPLLPSLGRHPFPLLLLFQVPVAVAVHILILTYIDELLKQHQKQIQSSGLYLPTTVTARR